jgi:hypothetical protein
MRTRIVTDVPREWGYRYREHRNLFPTSARYQAEAPVTRLRAPGFPFPPGLPAGWQVLHPVHGRLASPVHSRRRQPQVLQGCAPRSHPGPRRGRRPHTGTCAPTAGAFPSPRRSWSTSCSTARTCPPPPGESRTTRTCMPAACGVRPVQRPQLPVLGGGSASSRPRSASPPPRSRSCGQVWS